MSCIHLPSRRMLLKVASVAVAAPTFAGCLRTTSNEVPVTRPDALQRTSLLAVAVLGDAVLVAGERGALYLSKDGGKSWSPRLSGASVTLTALAFQASDALAVGHEGTILRSSDSGLTWTRVLDGTQIGRLATEEVVSGLSTGEVSGERGDALKAQAERLVADGPDKPLLDVAFSSGQSATAIGAYGILMQTADGGSTWKARMAAVDNPKGLHLNAIAVAGPVQVIVGEQGLCLRSEDGGRSYQRVTLPSAASMFSAAWSTGGELWCGGLNGRLLRSRSRGAHFESVDIGLNESVTTIAAMSDGRLVLGHVSGRITTLEPQTLRHRSLNWPDLPMLSELAALGDHTLIGVGARGPRRLSVTDLPL